MGILPRVALFLLALQGVAAWPQSAPSDSDWPAYGGSSGGQRYSPHTQINRENVKSLQAAWTFHTGTLAKGTPEANSRSAFEATPVLWNETLFFDTAFDEVFALNAETGKQRWAFDPKVDRNASIYIPASRGVALWHAAGATGHPATSAKVPATCSVDRVFVATLDRRLLALDARTGALCEGFGEHGTVDLGKGVHVADATGYGVTSPPTIVGDVVIVGSSIADNRAVDVASGAVRGFDARSGRQLWSWDPIPWSNDTGTPRAGSANVWSIMAADPEHGLVFLPTGSASTDGYGGRRIGDDRDANSIVALDAATGRKVWAFQIVHHDLWDYDVPAQPMLFQFRGNVPAVAVLTKQGMVYVFNRLTGEPLYPIAERPVPASTVRGERAWPTQPFSSLPPLLPQTLRPEDVTLADPVEREACRAEIAKLDNRGPFTPPSTQGTLLTPGPLGGANWGSGAFDPETGDFYVHIVNVPWIVRVIAHPSVERGERFLYKHTPSSWHGTPGEQHFQAPDSSELSAQTGTPYGLQRMALSSPRGFPCAPEPWGAVVKLNLNTGQKGWTAPLGTLIPGRNTGTVTMGGATVTRGGVLFVGAAADSAVRALDATTGVELWKAPLPAPAAATPMVYQVNGHEFVVICAGGEGLVAGPLSDAVIAFALPAAGKVKAHAPSKRAPHNGR